MSALFKQPEIRSEALMRWARNHAAGCQLRFPEWCAWGPTMGCHLPTGVRFGKGTGKKGPDILLALGCQPCHDITDGRIKTDFDPDFVKLVWHEGHDATLILMVNDGMVVLT